MSGPALLLLAALGASAVCSILLWVLPRLFRPRRRSFTEQLSAVSPRPGTTVGPARGVSAPYPLRSPEAAAEHDSTGRER